MHSNYFLDYECTFLMLDVEDFFIKSGWPLPVESVLVCNVTLFFVSVLLFLLIDKNKIPVSQNLLYFLKSLIGGLTISLHVTY